MADARARGPHASTQVCLRHLRACGLTDRVLSDSVLRTAPHVVDDDNRSARSRPGSRPARRPLPPRPAPTASINLLTRARAGRRRRDGRAGLRSAPVGGIAIAVTRSTEDGRRGGGGGAGVSRFPSATTESILLKIEDDTRRRHADRPDRAGVVLRAVAAWVPTRRLNGDETRLNSTPTVRSRSRSCGPIYKISYD